VRSPPVRTTSSGIWGKDTFVDFEQSLNRAVNWLRETLNEEPGQPRYVERVERREGLKIASPWRLLTVSVTFPPSSWKQSPD
jgi:hypothetical protein